VTKKLPMQPVYNDEHGHIRFQENKVVRRLLEESQKRGFGLNELACCGFSSEDQEQFAQLIGYSLSGASDLSYFSSETIEAAHVSFTDRKSEHEARADYLREQLDAFKAAIRPAVAELFGIHPDDLQS
jgi:hypothetical protein